MDDILSALLTQGIETGVFPGAMAAVSVGKTHERKHFFSWAGIKDNRYPDEKVIKETFFDLASLSKALSTTLSLYSLVNDNQISFSDKLGLFFTNIDSDKAKLTVGQLLSHSSGLQAYFPYFKEFIPLIKETNKEALLQLILKEKLTYPTGEKCVYSDLGFILLGAIIETVTGKRLDAVFKERITRPLGLDNGIMYLPIEAQKLDPQLVAATENCPWRKEIMRAEVHDEHCWLMGGISGHAGLFGRGEDVLKLCDEILDQFNGCGEIFNFTAVLQEGLQKQYSHSTWCLGFDTPSKKGSSGGDYLSAKSRGHLGYAGTSFWIDPEKNLVMVLLTNRVHPSRENNRIRSFRPYFHNRIIEELQQKGYIR